MTEKEGFDRGPTEGKDEAPKIQPIKQPLNITALAALGLFLLATLYTLYFARAFFIPVALAWMLSMLLKPLVRLLKRLHIHEAFGAAIILLTFLVILASAAMLLADPAQEMLAQAPKSLAKLETKIRLLMRPAEKVKRAAEEMEQKITPPSANEVPKVEVKKPGLLQQFVDQTKGAIYLIAEVIILLYFFLAAGDIFMLKVIKVLPRLHDKKQAVEIARETERIVSQYLLSLTFINTYEGVALGIGLAILGLPNYIFWGVAAFVANYIPYIGALLLTTSLAIVSLVTFDSVGHALLAPLIYFAINFSDNFVAPYIIGRRLVLNPVIVFLSVMFWGWIWGVVGVLLAVPIVMTFKIICDHNQLLAPIGEFLTGEHNTESISLTAGK